MTDSEVGARDVRPAVPSLLRTAWALFRSHWAIFVGAELAILAAWTVLEIAVVSVHRLHLAAPMGWTAWIMLHLGFLWIFSGLMTGIHAMALQVVDGGLPARNAMVGRFSSGGSYLLASSAYCVSVIAGLCLLVLPGVVVAVRWALFGHVLASAPSSARVALQEAAALSAGHRWALFRLVLLSIALNIAGAAVLGIGFLVSFPFTVLLNALFFRTLRGPARSVPALPLATSGA